MTPPSVTSPLDAARITPGDPWRHVEVHASIGSTNAAASALPPWSLVVADHQSAGRGRLGRVWQDTPGTAVAVSATLPLPPRDHGWVPLLTGVAMAEAVEEVTSGAAVLPGSETNDPVPQRISPALKWPNDLLVPSDGERKLAGILCELGRRTVVVGVGVNVTQGREQLPVPSATSLALCGAGQVERESLVAAFARRLAVLHGALVAGGAPFADVRGAYRERCLTIGRDVEVHRDVEAEHASVTRVRALAVDDDGRLVVEGPDGREVLGAGDVVHARL